jgi:hypothetical protein
MARLVDLQFIPGDERGNLVVIEAGRQAPFAFSRLFLLSAVPDGIQRGDHAHRGQHQLLIAVAGKFKVTAEDRNGSAEFLLDTPSIGLHAPPLTWLKIWSMAPNSTCAILASDGYDENDYIRNYGEFERLIRS